MNKIFTLVLVSFLSFSAFSQWNSITTVNNVVCDTLSDVANGTKQEVTIVKNPQHFTYIIWTELRAGGALPNIYIQKLDKDGVRQFGLQGLPVCEHLFNKANLQIINDGLGGVIVAWVDGRIAANGNDVYYQRIDATGNQIYGNGFNAARDSLQRSQINPKLELLDNTYFTIVWEDARGNIGTNQNRRDLYCNKFNISDGSKPTGFILEKRLTDNIYPEVEHQLLKDGAGGFYAVWNDARTNTPAVSGGLTRTTTQIYCERFNANLNPLFFTTGLSGINLTGTQPLSRVRPAVTTDNNGGFIVAWEDNRAGINNLTNIFAQRVDPSGNLLWPSFSMPNTGGVQVTTQPNNESYVRLVTDALGDVICAWVDERTGIGSKDIYATKLSGANGAKLWSDPAGPPFGTTDNTVPITVEGADQPATLSSLAMVSDKNNGVIIAWDDAKNTTMAAANNDIYAQRVDGNGLTQWSSGGVPISNPKGNQNRPLLVEGTLPTGPDGAIIIFLDARSSPTPTSTTAIFGSYVNNLGTLPISTIDNTNLSASKLNNGIQVKWNTNGRAVNNIIKYTLQKSTDGINFIDLASLNINTAQAYTYFDANPNNGANFYRIKIIYNNNQNKLTQTVNVLYGDNTNGVKIYPNPVVNNLNLQINNIAFNTYAIKILALDGKLISSQKITINTTNVTLSLPLTIIAQGKYILQIVNSNGTIITAQKFVK